MKSNSTFECIEIIINICIIIRWIEDKWALPYLQITGAECKTKTISQISFRIATAVHSGEADWIISSYLKKIFCTKTWTRITWLWGTTTVWKTNLIFLTWMRLRGITTVRIMLRGMLNRLAFNSAKKPSTKHTKAAIRWTRWRSRMWTAKSTTQTMCTIRLMINASRPW